MISEADRLDAIKFYLLDENSWQSPNRRDTKEFINVITGEKKEITLKYLTMTVAELFVLFCQSYPNSPIKKSTFYELRPPYVLPISDMPHNVCTCVYHENFNNLIKSLQGQNIADFLTDDKQFLEKVCCQIDQQSCMLNECKNCPGIRNLFTSTEITGDSIVQVRQWIYEERIIISKNKKDEKKIRRLELSESQMSVQQVIDKLEEKLEHFKAHYFINKVQSKLLHSITENVPIDTIVLQADFSEKFCIKYQDEAQSAYYNQQHITIFTCCAWSTKHKQSYCILSDHTDQDKYTVWLCLDKILKDVKSKWPNTKKVKIFSDGAGSQFKNKFTLSNLVFSLKDYGVDISWEFMATSHRKGAVDGIGACLKNKLWQAIRSRRTILKNAEDCHRYAEEQVTGIQTFLVDEKELDELKEKLGARWSEIIPIPDVKKMHSFQVLKDNILQIKISSISKKFHKHTVPKEPRKRKLRVEDVYTDSEDEKNQEKKSSQTAALKMKTRSQKKRKRN